MRGLRRGASLDARRETTDVERITAVAAASRAGLTPAESWRAWGPDVVLDEEGAPDLGASPVAREARVAARLAHQAGVPLADVLDELARVERSRSSARLRRETALAGPRASAQMLAWLPVAGLTLGALVEPGTVKLLAATPVGWALLGASGALMWLGRTWMRSLVRVAAQAGEVP